MNTLQADSPPLAQWLPQLLQTLNDNPDLTNLLQGFAGSFMQGGSADVERVDEPVEAQFTESLVRQGDHATFARCGEVLETFATAFGFCVDCVLDDEECDRCAHGETTMGVDDEVFMALVVPVLTQLKADTRNQLARRLAQLTRHSVSAAPNARPHTHEHDAQY